MAAADYTSLVQSIYISYFGRPADTFGLASFSAQLNTLKAPTTVNGLTAAYATSAGIKSLIDSFGASAESTALYGNDSVAFVSAIYNNVLNRAPDFDGLVFWVNEINAGRLTKANASLAIMAGAVNNTSAQGVIDAQVLANKVIIATNFTTAIDTGVELAAYSGNAAAATARDMLKTVTATTVPATFQATVDATLVAVVKAASVGTTFNLTTSTDTLTGGSLNDTFIASDSSNGNDTFTSLDKIDGGAGNDTLLISSAGHVHLASAAGATVTNVENVTLAAGYSIQGDVSGWTGLTELTLAAGHGTEVTAATTTNVTELNSVSAVRITGGNNVTINHKLDGDAYFYGNVPVIAASVYVNGAAGAVKITSSVGSVEVVNATGDVNVAAKGTITGSGKTFTATALGATTYADKVAHSTANTVAANAADAAAANLSIATDFSVAITAMKQLLAGASTVAANNTITYDALISGSITQAQKVAIDASFSAALAVPAATPAAAQAATAAIIAPVLAAALVDKAAATAAVALANAAAAPVNLTFLADGSVNGANVAAGIAVITSTTSKVLTSATVSGNYLAVGASATKISDESTLKNVLTSISLENGASAVLTGNAINTVSLKNYISKAVVVTNNTVDHTLTLNLDNVKGIGASFSDTAATLNINTATASSLAITDSSATSVKLAGAGSLSISNTSTFANTAAFDASAATGSVSLTVGAAQSFVGGAGNDTVSTSGVVAQTATLDGGAGTDRLVLTNNENFAGNAAAKFVNFETLQLNAGVSADVTAFTGSTITGVVLNNATGVSGLTAAQAGNVTVKASGTYAIGVAGATTVGQLDTLHLIVNDGVSARNTLTMTTPELKGVEVLTLTATDNVVINSLTSATALTNINIDGAGTSSIITGAIALNVNTVIDAHLATGGVKFDASLATTNGVKIIGSATAVNHLTGSVSSDIIIAGDGNNTISSGAASTLNVGGDTVTVGNGHNVITLNGSGAATVTAGNGYNIITTGAGNDTIVVGTGGNTVTGGAGGDIITFGAHVAGVIDSLNYTAANETFQGVVKSGVTLLTGIDVVTGMHAGDTINLMAGAYGFAAGATVGTTLAGTDNGVSFVKGSYNAATHIFTASATGADAMVQFDTDATDTIVLNEIVLVGVTGTLVAGAAGVLTLA